MNKQLLKKIALSTALVTAWLACGLVSYGGNMAYERAWADRVLTLESTKQWHMFDSERNSRSCFVFGPIDLALVALRTGLFMDGFDFGGLKRTPCPPSAKM
jgi:hypothetical protein